MDDERPFVNRVVSSGAGHSRNVTRTLYGGMSSI